jgi:hypothetical protein
MLRPSKGRAKPSSNPWANSIPGNMAKTAGSSSETSDPQIALRKTDSPNRLPLPPAKMAENEPNSLRNNMADSPSKNR